MDGREFREWARLIGATSNSSTFRCSIPSAGSEALLCHGAPLGFVAGEQGVLHRPVGMKVRQFIRKLRDQIGRSQTTLITQHLLQLERIRNRFSADIVVGENESQRGVLLDMLDSRLPLEQLLLGVQIIVRGDGPAAPPELALPILRIAPVQANVSNRRGNE